uniref:Uncharacterized protein n=1 Tax=Glossina brevipalpis TaxID=37001 RepID=A0A1A9WTH1_9MUSC
MVFVFLSVVNNYVSLPGAEHTSVEQPIILQVLNNNNNNKSQLVVNQTYRPQTSDTISLSSTLSGSPLSTRVSTSPTKQNVLDIESHLIETFDGYPHNEDESVGIRELTPIDNELRSGTSKIESSNNVRTIIEVEPVGVIVKKPLENIHLEPTQSALLIVNALNSLNKDKEIQREEIEEAAEILVKDIANEAIDNCEKNSNESIKTINQEAREENITTTFEGTRERLTDLEYSQIKRNLNEDHDIKHSQKQKTEIEVTQIDNSLSSDLTHVVNQQLSEVTSILDSQSRLKQSAKQNGHIYNKLEIDCNVTDIKVVTVPSPKTSSEEEERKLFIDSLPQIQTSSDVDDVAEKLALDCKKEYYQSLKKYLIQNSTEKPPVPLQTYRWEDLRRAKERGGYPWTHLYKRPLGPDEEPEIVLMLRKSQEIRFTSESPKSIKKVRIDEQVTIKETERYLQELSEEEEEGDEHHSEQHLSTQSPEDLENHSLHSESFSCISDSVLATGKPKKSSRLSKVRRIFRRRRYGLRNHEDAQSLPDTFSETNSPQQSLEQVTATQPTPTLTPTPTPTPTVAPSVYETVKANRCFPIMKKLKNMADRQKKRLHIKRIPLGKDEKIVLNEETKILKLKNSPKSQRNDIPHFIEKQDSDDILEIVELDESPSRKRKDDGREDNEIGNGDLNKFKTINNSSLVKPEEIIEITHDRAEKEEDCALSSEVPPKKAPRLRREHVYEEIDQPDLPTQEFNLILDATSVEALKLSLITQDSSAMKEVSATTNIIPLDRMGSSEEDQVILPDQQGIVNDGKSNVNLLAPISSIDSNSSDEDRNKKQLQPVLEEESDQPEDDQHSLQQQQIQKIISDQTMELKPPSTIIRKEASPAPSEKKVTFSYVEDEAEPHREDIELSPEHIEATKEANKRKAATMNARRSASVGALPLEKKHFVSRNESASGVSLDVRCACQYFQSDSLLPERINPVDSRPSSKLEFHHDPGCQEIMNQNVAQDQFSSYQLQSALNERNISRSGLMAGDRITQPEPDRLSMRSIGKHRSWDQTSVDISFLDKHPELEETAKSRGLVVRSISDADEPQMHGMRRQRFTSVDRMSNTSGGYGRDPETISIHSGISIRRISRSPSKADLFVADLNITTPARSVTEQRSVSASRRSSNIDLYHMSPQINFSQTIIPPDGLPDFSRSRSQIHSPSISPHKDYRIAKPPMSPDYMRPDENKENVFVNYSPPPSTLPISNVPPQNRPIDLSQYESEPILPDQTANLSQKLVSQPVDSLLQTVNELESAHKAMSIEDIIKIEKQIPSLETETSKTPLNVNEDTKIDIVTSLSLGNIEKLETEEETERTQNRVESIEGQMKIDTLQLPEESSAMFNIIQNGANLKRAHSPERKGSTEASNKKAVQGVNFNEETAPNCADIVSDANSINSKPTYASRFMSMFSSKTSDTDKQPEAPCIIQRERSPSRMTTVFSKDQATHLEVLTGSTAIIKNKPEKETIATKVVETFSLKVDEMDQYMTKPTKTIPPSETASLAQLRPSVPRSFYSKEDMNIESSSTDIKEAFTPIVIPRNSVSSTFLAGNRSMYASETEISNRGSEFEFRSSSKEPSIHAHPEAGGKPLFSAPILVGSHESFAQSSSPDRYRPLHALRSPSEQRSRVPPSNFLQGRTQSQDRARINDSSDNLPGLRMTKTVSFNFEDRKSRLSEFENLNLAQSQTEKENSERSYFSRDHEYEPIGEPSKEENTFDKVANKQTSVEQDEQTALEAMKQAEDVQKEMEEHFVKTTVPTPQMEIDVDTSELGEQDLDKPPKLEKKSFMASAQDRTRKMQAGLKNQAGKLRTKLRPTVKKAPSGSPKAKDRKRFKAPEFSKMKLPDIKRPDISKFKDFKRPEFTKFSKPDMSKFKFPDKITTMKLKRSKSLKENENEGVMSEENMVDENEKMVHKNEPMTPQKKLFNFSNFGTYPRALRKKKKPTEVESSVGTATATEATSVVPSTETQPSVESSSSPQGDRGPGPVRSRWADKFSDVSYNDSEGSRYRRYGSELESFDRESSLERRRDENEDTASEEPTLGILGGVTDNKQFAEFDEENRAIHEISNLRSGEFKRRPIVHQDSDLRSDDSKEAIGWTDKDIEKNTLLRKAEIEAEASFLKYQPEDIVTQETQSTASSGKKVVLEEIDENEFFLRKRGVSEDNIEIRQYISNAIREGYDMPLNSLECVGEPSSYGDYDVPPPKPRRLHQSYAPRNVSQVFDAPRDDYGDNVSTSQNGSDFFVAPKPPTRKFKGRSKYSLESQEEAFVDDEQSTQLPYFDNDEEYLRPPSLSYKERDEILNDLNMSEKENIPLTVPMGDEVDSLVKPQPPKRQKRRREISLEKDSYINGFSGRSVSNSFLQQPEDVIVYRTEHEYHHIPLATPEKYFDSVSTIRKSVSNYDYDDRTSRGAISLEQTQSAANERDRYLIDMNENDGYAVVRKDQVPKPTPPTRRKKFSRLPGERFATMPNMRTKRSASPPQRPPPPRAYTPTTTNFQAVTVRKSAHSLDVQPNYEDDYEEPGESGVRPESPRNLQSGEVINKMKYRPLPPPPRPPREKRQRSENRELELITDYQMNGDDQFETSGQESRDDEIIRYAEEVEASTQTDPLPDDFVCEEFEITDDMKIIEPRIRTRTLEEVLREEIDDEPEVQHQTGDSEQLSKGLQRFRDANQRSLSERSRASSGADRSKSQSRPQTPSAFVVERQLSTPMQKEDNETLVQGSLVVRPIDDLQLEEEQLRRDGLLTDSSQQSVSETKDELHLTVSEASYAPSSTELEDVLGIQASDQETQQTDEEVERTLQRYRDELDEIGRQLMETAMSQELSPTPSREQIKETSDTEEIFSIEDTHLKTIKQTLELSDSEPLRSDEESKIDSKSDLRSTTTLSELRPIGSSGEEMTLVEIVPQPPPRRKSNVNEQLLLEEATALQSIDNRELSPLQTLVKKEKESMVDFPCRLRDLEVERLRVNALQAGQIMVSQLHGTQITSDELECKSGNLIVKNIELPPGFIEDIVERVRQSEQKQLLSTEVTSNLEGSKEKSSSPLRETLPPPKPPRLRDLEVSIISKGTEITKQTKESIENADEGTQTEPLIEPSTLQHTTMPPVFPSAEYLHSLTPLAFYNLHRPGSSPGVAETFEMPRPQHYYRQRHLYQHRRSVSESEVEEDLNAEKDENELPQQKPRRRTHSARDFSDDHDNQSVVKAGRKFIAACSLSLAKIINQLTDYLRNPTANQEGQLQEQQQQPTDARNKQVPALVVLFIVITFAIIIFLVTGRNIHTHHWDYFNPPGHEGRQS